MASLQSILDKIDLRLSAIEQSLSISPPIGEVKAELADSSLVVAFDSHCSSKLDPFVAACQKLGDGASKLSDVVRKGWHSQRSIIVMASKCRKPLIQTELYDKLKDVQEVMKSANNLIERNEWELHGKAIKEGISCLNWLATAPPIGLPHDIVESAIGGSDYWANKIRVQYRKSGPPEQLEFCDTFKALLLDLVSYIKEHHKTGLEWNPKGGDLASYSVLEEVKDPASSSDDQKGGGMAAIFGDINKGLSVTGGLKKVTKDQQTWRAEYKGKDEPRTTVAPPSAAKAKPTEIAKPKAEPRFEFLKMGMKWVIENQSKDAGTLTVNIEDTKHSVYIYGCADVVIDIKGKCKSVCIDGCKKTKIFVEQCISSIEVVNCHRIQLQIAVSVPTIAIDKTDGILCYLSATAMETVFTSSKSSEMNISFPKLGSDEYMELPLPEQFVHSVKDYEEGKSPLISSNVSDLYTH